MEYQKPILTSIIVVIITIIIRFCLDINIWYLVLKLLVIFWLELQRDPKLQLELETMESYCMENQ